MEGGKEEETILSKISAARKHKKLCPHQRMKKYHLKVVGGSICAHELQKSQ